MKKYNNLKRIEEEGIIAVIRANNIQKAKEISLACIKGGITNLEITFTIPGAQKLIEELSEDFGDKLLIGAGTVLDSETARIAILAGANFIVNPGFDLESAKLCNRYRIPYMAGCMTVTEIIKALEAGSDVIKIFPGSAFGPDYIKALKVPLSQANLMPTGGVDINNVDQWIKNGSFAVGIGGNLTKGSADEIQKKAKQFIKKIKEARG